MWLGKNYLFCKSMSNVKLSKKLLWSKNEVVGLGFILLMGDSHWVYGFYFAEFGWAQSRDFFVGQSGCMSSLEIQESKSIYMSYCNQRVRDLLMGIDYFGL